MTDAGDLLPQGTRLHDLAVETVLGAGGFGVTYLVRDVSLGVRRAMKEYLPREWATRRADGTVGPRTRADAASYRWGLQRFLEEARILARFDHRNLVRVLRVFEARGTAYMVMEHVDGWTLKEEIAKGPLSEARVRELLGALADGLSEVHQAGLLHRDVKPGNVMVRRAGTPVLIDFGAARQAMGQHSRSLTAMVTPGYAPFEQYSSELPQGPWTDIYGLGALAYRALSGEAPAEAPLRVWDDRLVPTRQAAKGQVSSRLADAVDWALAVKQADRPQRLVDWMAALDVPPSTETASAQPQAPATGSATAAGRAMKGPARRRNVLVAVAACIFAAVLAVGLGVFRGGGLTDGAKGTEQVSPVVGTSGEAVATERGAGREGDSGIAEGTSSVVPEIPEEVEAELDGAATIEAALGLDRAARQSIQEGLAAAGFDPGVADGRFGSGTRAALRRWQISRKIAVSGYLTRESAAELQAAAVTGRAEDDVEDPSGNAEAEESMPSTSVLGGSAVLVAVTTPPGAEVIVDGVPVGETPLERSDIRAGVRVVTLRHPHCETVRIPDRRFEDGVALRVERVLQRGFGRLTVTVAPREAWVEMEGERVADRTPVTLEDLPAGPVQVRLGAPEHHALAEEIEIPMNGIARLERELERIPHGTLTLELEPPEATVILPDSGLRYRQGVRLPEGLHRVVVRSEGYEEADRTVRVSGSTRVRFALERRYGTLTLDLEPLDAVVTLPDSRKGYRPGVMLPEGTHRVVVRREGYQETVRNVEVSGAALVRIALPPSAGTSKVFDIGGIEMEFVWIPAGEFNMGSTRRNSDEWPVRRVRISRGYWLGKQEVTQGQWKTVMGRNPSSFKGCGSDCPVQKITWHDAQEFIGRLNARQAGNPYRLPTEAEWEYAARAGTAGDDASVNLNAIAWYYGNSKGRIHPVGRKMPNAFGLYDMLGNVSEWVQDWYGPYPEEAREDPDGPPSGSYRVYRGGSWHDNARECSISNRFYDRWVYGPGPARLVGLRVARAR